jgi:RNA polymerase sigma-70 factor (ECF subfamily)
MKEEQFKSCYQSNFQGLFLYAFTLVKDAAEAKDLVQTSFIQMWEKGKHINDNDSARAFLYTIVYRLSLNSLRNQKVRTGHLRSMTGNNSSGIVYDLEEKEFRQKLEHAVNQLPERCREVFLKVRMEGMKYRIVAKELGISEKTVETQMGRAVKMIKKYVSDYTGLFLFIDSGINLFSYE